MIGRFLLALALTPLPAAAESVRACASDDGIEYLSEPWEENTATFSNGSIRIAVIDRVEPATAAMHLIVLTPPLDEAGMRACRIVSADAQGTGFAFIDFAHRKIGYDPARGVTVEMDVTPPDPSVPRGRLLVTIPQDTGNVTARIMQ